MIKDDISLAQWALVEEIRSGKWTTLDFPKIAREDFGLNGIEFVNTLFGVPTATYLNDLKRNASDYGVEMVLIMVDDEGDGCASTKEERNQFAINQTNPAGADGAFEWSGTSFHQSAGSGNDGEDVSIVFTIDRQNGDNNLNILAEALIKQGA